MWSLKNGKPKVRGGKELADPMHEAEIMHRVTSDVFEKAIVSFILLSGTQTTWKC